MVTHPPLLAIVGPTGVGKTAVAVRLAASLPLEAVNADSRQVYRGMDIGTGKPTIEQQALLRHHLIDVVGATETYSAAEYAKAAAAAIHGILDRGRLPILVGGTGFYYRALVRGLFPGPARDDRIRARLDAVADRRGVESLHRWLARVDAESARRIQPRDRKRLVRALEVYLLTGRPLTDHFGETTSPIAGVRVLAIGVAMPRPALRVRVAARVDAQFARGVVAEVQGLMAAGVPASAHAFSGLVYRQVVEMLRGVRDETATRELIVRENMRYARRQLIWFRKEPNVRWLDGPGESPVALASVRDLVAAFLQSADVG